MNELMKLLLKAGNPAGMNVRGIQSLPAGGRLQFQGADKEIAGKDRNTAGQLFRGMMFGNNPDPVGRGVPLLRVPAPSYYHDPREGRPEMPPRFPDQRVYLRDPSSKFRRNRFMETAPALIAPPALNNLMSGVRNI